MAGGGWTGRWESSNGLDPLVFFSSLVEVLRLVTPWTLGGGGGLVGGGRRRRCSHLISLVVTRAVSLSLHSLLSSSHRRSPAAADASSLQAIRPTLLSCSTFTHWAVRLHGLGEKHFVPARKYHCQGVHHICIGKTRKYYLINIFWKKHDAKTFSREEEREIMDLGWLIKLFSILFGQR